MLTPAVDADVKALPQRRRNQFSDVVAFLAEDPLPLPGSDRVTSIEMYGRTIFAYADTAFPYTILYRVFGPESGAGLVSISALIPS